MTPKEIVQAAFQADISPALLGKGFSYVPSQFAYKDKEKPAGGFLLQDLLYQYQTS